MPTPSWLGNAGQPRLEGDQSLAALAGCRIAEEIRIADRQYAGRRGKQTPPFDLVLHQKAWNQGDAQSGAHGRQRHGEQLVARARIHGRLIFPALGRSEEHTSELQSLMRISYAVFCFENKIK